MNLINFFILVFFSWNAFGSLTLEEERKYDELEGLAFIQALVIDKKFEEAVRQFPTAYNKSPQKGHLYYLLAEAHYALKSYTEAHEALLKGEKYTQPEQYPALWGRTFSQLKKYKSCGSQFKKMPMERIQSADWEVYFNCLIKSGSPAGAVSLALNAKIRDGDYLLASQKTLITYGLLGIAAEKRIQYLRICRDISFYLELWSEVEKLKIPDISVLESGHACHPQALELTSLLVKNLFRLGQFHSIAFLFETLSTQEKEYLKHTAEFYKVAGRNTVADYFFILGDGYDYLMARSSYFLNQENYAALLTIPFPKGSLGKNKDLSYAIAYSHFKFLDLAASRSVLGISSTKNSKEKQLENLLDQCRDLDWLCRP